MTGPRPLSRQRSEWVEDPGAESRTAELGLDARCWRRNVHDGELIALVAEEPVIGWHLSVSHRRRTRAGRSEPGRYPTWDELADARYQLLPDGIDMVMHLPPAGEYVAVHPTTFHLHEHRNTEER